MTNLWRYRFGIIPLATALLLLLAVACSPAATPAPGDTGTTPAPGTGDQSTPVPQPTAAPGATQPADALRLAFGELGNQSMVPRMMSAFGKEPAVLVFDSIVGSDTMGGLSTERGIAEEWSMAEDALSWTFNLRPGVQFHNGAELTAEDARFTIEEVMREDSLAAYAAIVRNSVASMETQGDHTLIVHTDGPKPFFPWDVSGVRSSEGMVLPREYTQEVGDSGFGREPVGSGPYKVVDSSLGSHIGMEAAAPTHWREGPLKYQEVRYLIIPEESTRIANLETGQTDIADVSRERIAGLQNRGFNTFIKEDADVMGCYFHEQWEDVPVAKREVRQALNLAINRQELLDALYAGQGTLVPMYPIGSFAVPAGADPSLEIYPYDPDQARDLLASVGESDMSLTIASYTRQGLPELERTIQALAGYWEAIGVSVRTEAIEYGTFRDMRFSHQIPGWVSCLATPNRSAPPEILSIINILFHSEQLPSSIRNPEMDALIDLGTSTLDPDEVAEVIGDIHRWLHADYTTLPLLEVGNPFATRSHITDWNLGQDLYDFNTLDLVSER